MLGVIYNFTLRAQTAESKPYQRKELFSRVFATRSNQSFLNWGQDTPELF